MLIDGPAVIASEESLKPFVLARGRRVEERREPAIVAAGPFETECDKRAHIVPREIVRSEAAVRDRPERPAGLDDPFIELIGLRPNPRARRRSRKP